MNFKGDPLQHAEFVTMFQVTQPESCDSTDKDTTNKRQQHSISSEFNFSRIINPQLQRKTRTLSRFQQVSPLRAKSKFTLATESDMLLSKTNTLLHGKSITTLPSRNRASKLHTLEDNKYRSQNNAHSFMLLNSGHFSSESYVKILT